MSEPLAADEKARIGALLDLGRWDEALRLASALVARDPTDSRALVLQARSFDGAGRPQEAVAAARAAQSADPAWDEPFRIQAWSLQSLAPKDAVAAARVAVQRNPTRAANWAAVAFLAAQTGDLGEAERAAAEARRLAPSWTESLNVSGVVALKRKRPAEAEQWFRQGLALDPSDPHLLNNLALALRNQGEVDEAMALFERSLASSPSDQLVRRNLGATVGRSLERGAPRYLPIVIFATAVIALITKSVYAYVATAALIAVILGLGWYRRRHISEARRSALRDHGREQVERLGRTRLQNLRLVAILFISCLLIWILGAYTRANPQPPPPPCVRQLPPEEPGGPPHSVPC